MDMLTKVCTECKIEKELTEFYKHKGGKHGVKGKCKKCHDIKSKEYRETHKERFNEYQKKYRESEKGKETFSKALKKYRESEKFRTTTKKYYEENKREVKKLREQVKEQQEYIDMLWDYIVSQTGMTEEEWKNL